MINIKKFILYVFCLIMFMGVVVHAETSNPASDQLRTISYSYFGVTVSDVKLDLISDRWEERGSDYSMFLYAGDGPTYQTFVISDSFFANNQNGSVDGFIQFSSVSFSHYDTILYRASNGSTSLNYNSSSAITLQNCLYLGTYDEFLIDYTTYDIDYQLPVPDITPYYGNWDLSGYWAPFIFNLHPTENNNLYLQAFVKYYAPSDLLVDQNGNFKVMDRSSSNYYNLVGFSEKIGESAFTSAMDDLDENWVEFAQTVTPSISGINPVFEESDTFDYLVNKYNTGSKVLGVYGSVFEVWVRYWYIDSSLKVKVGQWWHWNNTVNDYFTLDIPPSMTYGNPSSGIVSHNMEPLEPSGNNVQYLGTPTGNSNGTGINITVNPNTVPNTYQYPTVTTFNHDNLLVQFIATAQQLPDMFTGYANFLSAAFVFIPAQIWTIIGFGFLSAIAIMIIKIL